MIYNFDITKKEFILITSSNFPVGGAGANYLYLFCKGLKENHQSISVWLLKGFAFGKHINVDSRFNLTEECIPYFYLSSILRPVNWFRKLFADLISIMRLIIYLFRLFNVRKSTILLIYNDELHFNIPIFCIGRLIGLRIVSFVPEYLTKNLNNSIFYKIRWYGFLTNFKYLNPLSDKLIVFSYFLKEMYIERGIKDNKIIVQPNLTNFDYWQTNKSTIKYTIGYSGTPSVKDGVKDLLKAISILRKRGTDVTLLIIGDNIFGKSLLPDFRKLCEQFGIANLVSFTGLVDLNAVKKYLSECEILALTRPDIIQTQAGFPTKLGEYIATGKNVLMTNFGDLEKYFIRDNDMVIAHCGDIDDIADKIQWIIDNPRQIKIISRNGYLKAKKLLDYKSSVQNIIALLNLQ